MARGEGSKGGAKRCRTVLRNNIQGITKPEIRRLARRGGVKRISGLIYEETRVLSAWADDVNGGAPVERSGPPLGALVHEFEQAHVESVAALHPEWHGEPSLPPSKRILLHRASQAFHLLENALMEKIRCGDDSADETKYVDVNVLVSTLAEFDAVFDSVKHLRLERIVRTPTCSTYTPDACVTRRIVTYAFRTLREWAEFIGRRLAWASPHKFRPDTYAYIMPNTALARGSTFDDGDVRWNLIVAADLQPLALSRAIPGASDILKSDIGRTAAADARDFKVFLLDRKQLLDGLVVYYVFVRAGYAAQPPVLRSIAENDDVSFSLCGHFGWVPADVLSWDTKTAGLVTISFTETLVNDLPNLNLAPPKLKFRPMLANSAGNIGL
jgi:hypothetical protein